MTRVSSIHLVMQTEFYISVVTTSFFGDLKNGGLTKLSAQRTLGQIL